MASVVLLLPSLQGSDMEIRAWRLPGIKTSGYLTALPANQLVLAHFSVVALRNASNFLIKNIKIN
jgi:hypothetical protein